MSESKHNAIISSSGFTLVELLLAVAISLLAMAAIVAAYLGQNRSYVMQQRVVDAQQTARAAMYMLTDDIRMAGASNLGADKLYFTEATPTTFAFDQQATNGNVERVTYAFCDGNGDGVNDSLCRMVADNNGNIIRDEIVANNIDALEFFYTVGGEGSGPATVAPNRPDRISAVQVSLLARAESPDPSYRDVMPYTPASGSANWNNTWPQNRANPPNDNFHRRLVIENVVCRNMVN